MRETMLFKFSTDWTVSESATALEIALQDNHFGVMHVHNLKETMAKKGRRFAQGRGFSPLWRGRREYNGGVTLGTERVERAEATPIGTKAVPAL